MFTSGLNPHLRVQGERPDVEHEPTPFGARIGKPIYDSEELLRADGYRKQDAILVSNPLLISTLKKYDQNDESARRRARFSVNPGHSMWITDDASLRYYTDVAREALNNTDLPDGELEDFEKIGYQISHKPHWHIPSSDFIVPGDEYAAVAKHAVDLAVLLFKELGAKDYREMQPYKPYPNSTNGGAPHYRSGEFSFLMDLSLAGLLKADGYNDGTMLTEGMARYKNPLPPHSKATLRAKLTRKAVPILSRRGNEVYKIGESYKITDTRLAYMGQRYVNMTMARMGSNANYFLYKMYSFVHSTPDKTCKVVDHFGIDGAFSLDYSGYDTTMHRTFQNEIKRLYSMFATEGELDIWWHQLQSSVLTGPVMGKNSIGCLLDKEGQLSSGTRTTSADGCFINIAATLYSMQKGTGMSDLETVRSFLGMKWGALIWGDDTVIFPPSGFNRAKYLEGIEELGLKATIIDEIVFLKKRFFLDSDGKAEWYPIVFRSL